MDIESHVTMFLSIVIPIFVTALILYIVRVIKGPTISDMVIALDALGYDLAVFLVVLAIYFKIPILVSCAIVLALWVYALDIYVAKYLEAKEMGE